MGRRKSGRGGAVGSRVYGLITYGHKTVGPGNVGDVNVEPLGIRLKLRAGVAVPGSRVSHPLSRWRRRR